MLKKSRDFASVQQVKFLAKGGESVVYSIMHQGVNEVVAKVPVKDEHKDAQHCYQDLIMET